MGPGAFISVDDTADQRVADNIGSVEANRRDPLDALQLADCIVEAPGYVDKIGINMVEGIELPLSCAATCQARVDVQRLVKEAAERVVVSSLNHSMLHEPLAAAAWNRP